MHRIMFHSDMISIQMHCVSAPCDSGRPPPVADGMVRYHGVQHGDKAKYKCNTGYKLVGDHTMVCQFGEWIGEKPYCDPSMYMIIIFKYS